MTANDRDNERITLSLRIHGRVQGVGFRWSLREEALALGLSGWVRNRHDGSVEALARGPEVAVSALVEWAGKGPPGALVLSVEAQTDDSGGELTGFEQRPTV